MSIFLNNSGPGLRVAAPSWVIPGTIAENCRCLEGKVDEIGLLFFETESCLGYSDDDLPAWLSKTGLSFHVHHPLDLPWDQGGASVAEIVIQLMAKVQFLAPSCHVIHPPQAGEREVELIRDFAETIIGAGHDPDKFCFENIKENSLSGLVNVLKGYGFKICLDLGHILAYAQYSLLDELDLEGMVGMLHLNAPGAKGKHESLESLDAAGLLLLGKMLKILGPEGIVTVELFKEKDFFNSLQFLNEYYTCE